MKNLLVFTALFTAGFLLGSRRAAKPIVVVAEFKLRGADLVAASCLHNYRNKIGD